MAVIPGIVACSDFFASFHGRYCSFICVSRQGCVLLAPFSNKKKLQSFFSLILPYNSFHMKGVFTILLLVISNVFMTIAWYGHLKFQNYSWFSKLGLWAIVLISWGIALFEYAAQVPANKMGYSGNGGPFNLWQLKVLQEVITLIVFTIFTLLVFKNEQFRVNHLIGFFFLVLAVYFIFKK